MLEGYALVEGTREMTASDRGLVFEMEYDALERCFGTALKAGPGSCVHVVWNVVEEATGVELVVVDCTEGFDPARFPTKVGCWLACGRDEEASRRLLRAILEKSGKET